MTPGTSQSSNALRIRDNQRRSRARRKEYIDDLEQRIRQFERQGVEATTEVQTAARKVAKENALLRSLLVARGVSNTEIEDYLRGKDYNNLDIILPHHKAPILTAVVGTVPKIPPVAIRDPKIPAPYSPCKNGSGKVCQKGNEPPTVCKDSQFIKARTLPQVVEITTGPPGLQISPLCPPSSGTAVLVDSTVGPVPPSIPVPDIGNPSPAHAVGVTGQSYVSPAAQNPDSHLKIDDETTCEVAANIIASMRGYGDADGVRAELGCSENESCAVKNIAIFELIDGDQTSSS